MDRTERFYRIDQLIQELTVVPFNTLMKELGVARATVKRDLEYMRSRLYAPIEYDRLNNGYRYSRTPQDGPRYQLPSLWFNSSEIHALLSMQELLGSLDPGILARHVAPLRARLNAILDEGDASATEVVRRIRIVRMAARGMKPEFFEQAASATLKRQRLAITFWSRSRDETTERVVSPQRLVFYRGNWYLDAWCHLRGDIRSFALDGIREAKSLDEAAQTVPDKDLDAFLASSYGIFSGAPRAWAKLHFTRTAARWVSYEKWHSQQRARHESDGSYILEVPYSDDTELVMDILKFGPECRVLEPPELAEKVAARARATADRYA
jgi:predicted DNA-binding transcriptional regulator YafY